MRRNPIVSTAIAIAFVAAVSGPAPSAAAQTADTLPKAQTSRTPAPPNGAGAIEQNRTGGQFSPGGVPTKNQATSQPSVPPNGVGAAQNKRPGGDFGPGGAPTTGQAATSPSRNGPGGAGAPSDKHADKHTKE
ncbi:MAG: hypothetical protein ACM3OF_00560 [Gemmatimonas sp.]